MALNHDENGFLSGPKVTDDLGKISRDVEILKGIRKDTRQTVTTLGAIARGLGQAMSRPTPDTPRSNGTRSASTPIAPVAPIAPLGSTGRRKRSQDPAGTPGDSARPQRKPAEPSSKAKPPAAPKNGTTDEPRKRDAGGRFGSDDVQDTGSGERSGRLSAAGESARSAASGIAQGADNLDPSIQAAKELGGIVAPITGAIKPLGRVFGMGRSGEDKRQRESVTWYRRIWNSVKGEKGGKGGMSMILTGLLSMLGMLLGPLRALGRMLGLMRGIAALGGLLKGAGALGGRGGRAGRNGRRGRNATSAPDTSRRGGRGAHTTGDTRSGRRGAPGEPSIDGSGRGGARTAAKAPKIPKVPAAVGGMLKGVLKKLPLIGSLVGGAMLASSLLSSDDPDLSPEENKKNRYASVGSGVGGIVGGVVGLFGGPAGAIAGAMIGDQLGEMVGGWLATVDLGAIPGQISETFTDLKEVAFKLATDAFGTIQEGWKNLTDIGSKALSGLGDWAKEKWGKATDALLEVRDNVADKVQTAKDYVGEKATTVKDAGQNLLNKATGGKYTGGSNAAKDEMIKAMDAGGITDPNSKAALMANVDHESGGFTKKEENLNYSAKRLQEVFPKYYKDAESARADAGNPEAIANKVYGGRMGNTEAGDGYKYRGRGNLQLTGKAQYEEMGKKLGIDLVNDPDLAMDPKYSAQIAVQHWKSSGADKAAQAGNFDLARKKTNGGLNGIDDVNSKMDGYLAQAKAGDLTPTRRADEGKVQAPAAATSAIASTMATVKGAATVGGTPALPATLAPRAPGALGANTVGIMAAPTTAPATTGLSATKPISAGALMAPTYSPPAPDAAAMKLSPTPSVEKPMMGQSKAAAAPSVQLSVPLTQNVDDRKIAHVAGGGIGM